MLPKLKRNLYPENIPDVISGFRPDREVPVLDKCFDGGQFRIYKVDFTNGESWAVRIPLHIQATSQDTILSLLRAEQDVLQELAKKGFPWAPKHYGSNFTFENPVGFPFMVLSWIEGTPLSWTASHPQRPVRDKVLSQVAEIQLSLIKCTEEKRGTATEYFSRTINNRLCRVRNGHLPNITEQDCFAQKNLLPKVLYPELDDTPFAIDHGDLSPQNIIVDLEYNVTGIIDWGFAAKAPVQLAGGLPRFLQLQELSLPPSTILQEDRKAFIASFTSCSSQVGSWMSLIQSSKDVDFRTCFLESIISKGIDALFAGTSPVEASLSCPAPRPNRKAWHHSLLAKGNKLGRQTDPGQLHWP